MPSASAVPGPTRRTVLLAGLAAGVTALAAACSPRPTTAGETPAGEPDPLVVLVDAARSDAALATAAAVAAPAAAGLLGEVAAARTAHADALAAEVARAAGTIPGATSTSPVAPTTAPQVSSPAAAPPPPAVGDVVAALAAARGAAEEAAVAGPDYRAGLLGSVAAACAVAGGALA